MITFAPDFQKHIKIHINWAVNKNMHKYYSNNLLLSQHFFYTFLIHFMKSLFLFSKKSFIIIYEMREIYAKLENTFRSWEEIK